MHRLLHCQCPAATTNCPRQSSDTLSCGICPQTSPIEIATDADIQIAAVLGIPGSISTRLRHYSSPAAPR